jgi:hypothetical protein
VFVLIANDQRYQGPAVLVQGRHRVEALVRIAAWPAGPGELAWAGHFLYPNPPRLLTVGKARLKLPQTADAEIVIEYRECGGAEDLGGDFIGQGSPPERMGAPHAIQKALQATGGAASANPGEPADR